MMDDQPLRTDQTLDGLLGFRVTARRAGRIAAVLPIRDALREPAGPVHAGTYAALADALALLGTLDAVGGRDQATVPVANNTNVLEPGSGGNIHAVAGARALNDKDWVWEVEFRNDAGTLSAVSCVTLAVPEARGDDAVELVRVLTTPSGGT